MLPILFLPLSWKAVFFVLINRLGAEILTNIHTFLIIVPNHTADDIQLFENNFDSKEEFFLRQVLTSCNYRSPTVIHDYFYGYLNYQIEHHLFTDFPLSKYRALSQKLKSICEKYDIPYLEEPIGTRIYKTFDTILSV